MSENVHKDTDENVNLRFFDIFPEEVFGPIPNVLSKLIVNSGFDRLVTFATLTSDELNTLQTENTNESKEPLKLGYQRLLTQMVDFAQTQLIMVEAERIKAEGLTNFMTKVPQSTSSSKFSKTLVQSRNKFEKQKANNAKEVLMQSIQKTIKKFCRANQMESFTIVDLDILKSTEGRCPAAQIICLCGEKVRVYTTIKNNSVAWVTSNMVKHLSKQHLPNNTVTKATSKATSKATHYLDEAEHLSDNVLILNDGEVISENNSETLKNQFTKSFDIQIKLNNKSENRKIIEQVKGNLETHAPNSNIIHLTNEDFHINIPYYDSSNEYINFNTLIQSIEDLHTQQSILHFRVVSKDLVGIFSNLNTKVELDTSATNGKDHSVIVGDEGSIPPLQENDQFDIVKNLFWKRFTHFKRNYRMLLFVLALPAIFEALAMTCMIFRPKFSIIQSQIVTQESEWTRNFLNRLFLVFPQHAFTDGLLEICKNHVIADILERFYIHIYKSPISSSLLMPHFLSLLIYGLVFMLLNYLIETGHIHRWMDQFSGKLDDKSQLNAVVSNDQTKKEDKYDLCKQDNVLLVENLCKTYKGSGECFGLLGANGAEKSTVFSILSGQIYQSSGSVQVLDKRGISYCPQTNALDGLLTVEEVIQFYGRLRKIPNIENLTSRTLKSFHLEQYKNILVKNLSGGNRRKLSVAVTCFGDTRLVLMDEPTSDMDPVTRALVYKTINSLIVAKRSIILTSHTISEIEEVCDRIGVMRDGEMISMGTPMALKERFGQSYVVTLYYDQIESLTIEGYVLKNLDGVENLTIHNNCLQFSIKVKTSQCGNSINGDNINRILLSDLFNKLYIFTSERRIAYTISECLLDQVFQQVESEGGDHSYCNAAFAISETKLH